MSDAVTVGVQENCGRGAAGQSPGDEERGRRQFHPLTLLGEEAEPRFL
jgi:hypothetical protein